MTKVDQASAASRTYIRNIVHEENDHALIVESIHRPRSFIELSDWNMNIGSEGIGISELEGKRVMAVSAIGNPASFEQTLADLGIIVVESLRFPDHHDYLVDEMMDAVNQAINLDADAVVITEKDAVKVPMPPFKRDDKIIESFGPIPIYVLSVEVTFEDGADELRALVNGKIKEKLHH